MVYVLLWTPFCLGLIFFRLCRHLINYLSDCLAHSGRYPDRVAGIAHVMIALGTVPALALAQGVQHYDAIAMRACVRGRLKLDPPNPERKVSIDRAYLARRDPRRVAVIEQ